MKQKKTTVPLKQPKKKVVKRTKSVNGQKKISKKLLIGIAILFIMLFVIVFFSSQPQILKGNAASAITPTFGIVGPCQANSTCPTGSPTGGGQQISIAPGTSGTPQTSISPSNPASNPCIAAKDAQTTTMSKKNGGSQGGFLQLILQFFQMLLQLIEQLLGGGTGTTPGNPLPTLGAQPSQGAQPSGAPATSPSPCPSSPSSSPQPSGSQTQPSTGATTPSAAPSGTTTGGTTAPSIPTTVPAGFTRGFTEDFNTPAALGSFDSVYGSQFGEYTGCCSTNKITQYDANTVLYVQNGSMYYNLHSTNGQSYAAAPQPWNEKSFLYGQVGISVRLDSSTGPGYKIAFLLWPATNAWSNEVDFPEVDPDFTAPVRAASLNYSPNGQGENGFDTSQDNLSTGVYLTDHKYHTFLLDWEPGKITTTIDGKVVATFTGSAVPSQAMRLSLQAEGWINQGAVPTATTDVLEVPWVYINTFN